MSDWIKVTEQMPGRNDDVLVSDEVSITIAHWSGPKNRPSWFSSVGCQFCGEDIVPTHWMKLPKMPAKEGE